MVQCIVLSQVPIYDFKQSKRVGYRTQMQPTSRVVIIEGIYSLSTRLRLVSSCTAIAHACNRYKSSLDTAEASVLCFLAATVHAYGLNNCEHTEHNAATSDLATFNLSSYVSQKVQLLPYIAF